MRVKSHIWYWFFGIVSLWTIASSTNRASAQIVPDGTLNTQVKEIPEEGITMIEGGTSVGRNLFHSFKEFGMPKGDVVFFNNDVEIKNIITRVTGESISNFDGLMKSNSPNLVIINHNGIISENALLDLGDGDSLFLELENYFQFNDTNLPEISLNPKSTITCSTTGYAQSSFTIVGRDGSLTPSYLEPLTGSLLTPTQLAKLEGETKEQGEEGERRRKTQEVEKENSQIVEAQGWVRTKSGKIILVANASDATVSSHATASGCPSKK